jgi:hypothetical protein
MLDCELLGEDAADQIFNPASGKLAQARGGARCWCVHFAAYRPRWQARCWSS